MLLRRTANSPAWDWTSPFEQLERLRKQINLLSGGPTGERLWTTPAAGVFPLINVTEDKDNYYVRAELPGLKADDLELSVTGDTLSISGERKIPAEDEKAQYHRRERDAGRFSRIVSLPAQLNTGKVEASCTDGVLAVTLPKAEEAKPRQIAVKTS
jgi:HSP20 family protein